MDYLRFPHDPKWTYQQFMGGAPIFDPTASDFQDLEISQDDFVKMVQLVCQYAGLVIRENVVIQYMNTDEQQNDQKK